MRRIGTCRKKVMGLLRLMGNKADVVKGLAKRCKCCRVAWAWLRRRQAMNNGSSRPNLILCVIQLLQV